MATIAKHIRIARSEGPEAGMEAYLAAPSSKIHPAYARITRKRTQESKIKAYCTEFADKLGNITQRVPVQQDRFQDDVQGAIEAQVTAAVREALAGIMGGRDEDDEPVEPSVTEVDHEALVELVMDEFGLSQEQAERNLKLKVAPVMRFVQEVQDGLVQEDEEHITRVPEATVRVAAESAKARSRKKAPTGAITAGEAWIALGGGETFEPNDPDKEANNGQLYRLNVQGKLALVS